MKAWSGVGAAYAASYAALCAGTTAAIVSALGAAHSRRVLDIGAGTGALAARLQDAGWSVIGCEPESTMRTVAVAQHPHVEFIAGALPTLPFSDSVFDAVTANFVLNHVPDPRAAAADMARVSRRDGMLLATTWTASPSWFWREVCEQAGLEPAVGERLPASKDFERTASGFRRMLTDGGWHGVELREIEWTWDAPREALWTSVEGGVGIAGAHYLSLDDAERGRFRRAFDELCDARGAAGVVPLEHTAALAVGQPGESLAAA